MKRSGMHWRQQGGQAIVTFRAMAQSDRFDRGRELVAKTYKMHIAIPEARRLHQQRAVAA